jgi:hypothetical protein
MPQNLGLFLVGLHEAIVRGLQVRHLERGPLRAGMEFVPGRTSEREAEHSHN